MARAWLMVHFLGYETLFMHATSARAHNALIVSLVEGRPQAAHPGETLQRLSRGRDGMMDAPGRACVDVEKVTRKDILHNKTAKNRFTKKNTRRNDRPPHHES